MLPNDGGTEASRAAAAATGGRRAYAEASAAAADDDDDDNVWMVSVVVNRNTRQKVLTRLPSSLRQTTHESAISKARSSSS